MKLKNIVPRTEIQITFTETPIKESVYVGVIQLEKNGETYLFDFNEYEGSYNGKVLTIDTKDLAFCECPEDAKLEDLEDARVIHIFLQGEEEAYMEDQMIEDIELSIFDIETHSMITLTKGAFSDADLAEYYEIQW